MTAQTVNFNIELDYDLQFKTRDVRPMHASGRGGTPTDFAAKL